MPCVLYPHLTIRFDPGVGEQIAPAVMCDLVHSELRRDSNMSNICCTVLDKSLELGAKANLSCILVCCFV